MFRIRRIADDWTPANAAAIAQAEAILRQQFPGARPGEFDLGERLRRGAGERIQPILFVAEKADDITVTMPASWAADEVILQADADKIQNAFSDAKLGAGAGGRGEPGTGLASLKLTSKEFAGSTGTITLR